MLTGDALHHQIGRRLYIPGWQLTVADSTWSGPWLRVLTATTNSRRPDEPIVLDIQSATPPQQAAYAFDQWMVWRLIEIASHETREWYRDTDGIPIFDPHHQHANLPARP